MKIELQSPFKERWRKGYLRTSKEDGRSRVDLFNSDSDRTTISYSRYLMSVKVGYELGDDVEVDHIDKNNSNDDINNLQILTLEEHRNKTAEENTTGRNFLKLLCPECNNFFEREARFVHSRFGSAKQTFCSRSCNGKNSRKIQLGRV